MFYIVNHFQRLFQISLIALIESNRYFSFSNISVPRTNDYFKESDIAFVSKTNAQQTKTLLITPIMYSIVQVRGSLKSPAGSYKFVRLPTILIAAVVALAYRMILMILKSASSTIQRGIADRQQARITSTYRLSINFLTLVLFCSVDD